MYEKEGLMSKLSNPMVLAYLRRHNDRSNTDLIESALRKVLGLPPKEYAPRIRGNNKMVDCRNVLPVKVSDPKLIDHLVAQKRLWGISHRHTIENAILKVISEGL